jgi:hypothetical protein
MDANIKIITDLKNFIAESSDNTILRALFTTSQTDFTRERKLGFERLVLLLINFFKRSYSIEIAEFYNWITPEGSPVSKSAFCQQRMKIKDLFFDCLNQLLVQSFYTHHDHSIKRWHGMRMIAVDGTTVYLIDNEDVISHFGTQKGHSNVPMGQALSAFDVLNGITIKAGMYPIKMGEQKIARHWLPGYDPDMLLIYDRGYPGFTSIFLHENKEQPQPFLMRCRLDFTREIKAFVSSNSLDTISVFRATKQASEDLYQQGFIVPLGATIRVRLVKVILDNGTIEVLVTNLFDNDQYPQDVFKELYFKRWGIETNYNTIKSKLQLEAFSGQKVITIMQDFHITFFLSNLQQIIGKPVEYELATLNNKKKYQYKVNKNIAFGIMKNRIIDLFMSHDPDKILTLLQGLFIRYLEPVRPNRKYPHRKKFARINGKYQALNNYKRAI